MKSFINSNGRKIMYSDVNKFLEHTEDELKEQPEIVCINKEDVEVIMKALVYYTSIDEIRQPSYFTDIELATDRLIDQYEGLIYSTNKKRNEVKKD